MPLSTAQLVQSYLDWIHQSPSNGLLGTLVVHLGTSLSQSAQENYVPTSVNYDQVVAAEGLANQGQDSNTIAGSDWHTFTAHNSFEPVPGFTYNVTVNKSGVVTTQPRINGQPVGGVAAIAHNVSTASNGLVITVIEENVTYTLSFRKFVFEVIK
jgi:hypothetical protein